MTAPRLVKSETGLGAPAQQAALERRQRLWARCCRFGAGYGAALGGSYGLLWALGVPLLLGVPPDPLTPLLLLFLVLPTTGLALGALGGSLCGSLAARARSPLAWGVVGAVGGILAGLLPLQLMMMDPPGVRDIAFGSLIFLGAPALGGGAIGAAVGRGVRSGESRLPHVETLAAAIREADAGKQQARLSAGSHELAPSAAPEGCGEELSPAHTEEVSSPRTELVP